MNHPIICRLAGLLSLALALSSGAEAAPKIGVLLKAKTEFWAAAEKGALSAGERLGAEVTVKAPMRESDINVQIQFLNAFVAQGMNAIVIAPASKDALIEPVAAALAKGVKVVVIDTMLAGGQMPVFVGTDQREAGRAGGRFLAGFVADGDEVGIFKHSQTSGATEQRELGAVEALRERHPNIVLHGNVYASGEPGVEPQRAALLLEQFPKSKAILASGTPGTMAMLKVLQQKKLAGTVRFAGFGFNLNPTVAAALEAGEMDAWIAQQPGEMGAQGVASALALVEGREVAPVIRIEFIVITKSNLADPKVQALLTP
jgi:ribose transport system substrate-binding protein